MADQSAEAANAADPGHSQNPDPQAQQVKRPQDNNATFLRAARAGNLDQVLEFLRNGININTSNSNGLNALHLASKEGHNEVVRELIRRNADVDAATRKGNTALHIASLAGQDIIVTILVENGANVNAQSTNGFTPLYMAAQENHEAVVRYLLAHNANQALATEDGFTPLAVALQQGHDRVVALLLENDNNSKVKLPALHIAAKKDDTRAAGLLLQSEQNPNVTSKSGFTPLHISAHYGNENVAQLLIEKGANVNYQARHNISPLHVAAKWGRVNLVKLLLQNGAVIDCRTRDLLTPLHCAARSGHELVVDLLLEQQAPIGAKTKNGLAPLHMAAQGDHVDCARNLLYHQAPVDDVTVDYLTPLHVAAHCGHVQAAKLLLDRHADPNARALNGFTPLHIACKKNRIQVVELLLKYYASLEATTESGLSPLHVASFMGCISIVIYLIQQGAKVDVETVRGETPLHLAARANQTDIVRVLVRNGAKVDAQARELQTPLHIASRLGNTDIVHILLNANADPNAASRDEYTALHIAAKEDKEEVAQILLDHKANKSALTRKGFTPLHLASKYGNYNVAKLLLEGGTPVDIEGKNQVTPLHVAAHYNNDRVAQLLLENGAFAQATAKNGYTPLHIAAKKNQMDIASALLSYKADPNATSKAGFTPLHLASESGHTEMSGLLIENGSMVNARANNGLTPLHLCAQEDNVDAARVLLSNRAEVNAQTKAGYTPLHVACHFGQLNMVRLLIEHGALVSAETTANYTPLHQAAQQGHNSVVRYLLEHGASPNSKTVNGQTPLSIAQRLGYVSVVETLKTVTETTVITETTTVTEERYKPQNPERMNETMFSDSEDEVDETQASAQDHARDFNESITQGLHDSAVIHLIHTGEQMKSSAFDTTDADLDAVIKRAQAEPVTTAIPDPTFLDQSADDNVLITRDTVQPSFLISFLVDARGGAMRGCRHSGVRVIIPPRKAAAPMRITCRYLRKEKLAHPPPLSEGEALASRILEMGPHSAKFLGPVVLEVPHFASLRGREREIVILRSDDGQHWKEHQLEATEDAVQEVLNESFDAAELQQLDDLHSTRITRILTNDFPMYFAVVTRVRQEVHCVGPEGGVILSSVVPRVQAIFPDGSLTKTIKVSLQAQPIPHETVVKLHGNRVAVSPIVTVEPRRRKFHKPITLCIPLPQSGNKGMLTQYANGQPGQEPPTLRLLCSITGGSSPAQWEDITGTTQLTFTGEEVSFTTTVSARFWLMDCQTPRDAARMAQEVYADSICVPYMAKFVVFARRPFPIEGQLRLFCMTDDREDKTLEKQEGFIEVAKSRDVEVLSNRHQFLEFAGNLVPITKSGDQLSVFFLPFQENRLGFNVKVRQHDDQEAATTGRIAIMKEARIRAENIPPQHPICTLSITLPDYRGQLPPLQRSFRDHQAEPIATKYAPALSKELDPDLATQIDFVTRKIGGDWMRMSRSLGVSDTDTRQIKREMVNQEPLTCLKIWSFVKGEEATIPELHQALRRIGRDDIVHKLQRGDLDSDSLRLIDSSNLHLDRTSITSRDDVRAVDRSQSIVRHEETSKAEPSSIERDLTPQHDDESPHHMQESMIVEETEEEHEPSPAVASEPEPHLRGEGGTTDYGTALKSNEQPDGLKQRNATEEAWTSADGNEAVTKRTIRQSTTTHSGITGAGDHELKDDSDTSSSSSVRDRIQRFESLKQTTAPTSTRRTISIVEEQQSTTEAKHEVDHSFPRPTEIDVQPQEKVVETVEHTDSNVPETPTASVTVEELVEQIGSATTVSTPPKELEVSASPTESRTSVHSLIQKFSHPKENVNESHKEDEQKIAHEPTKEINEESTIIEHYEYQPATHAEQLQTGIDSVRFVTEDVAQQMTREPPSTKTNEPVELIEEISTSPSVLVAEQQQKRTVESAVSMESDHDYQENDEYKHEPSSINATQHELAFDMATHQTLSDTEHKLPTNVGIEENIEATDESSRHTRSVPIQRLATGELVDEDRATAEGQATQPLLSPSETSSEKKESVSISQEIAYNKETVEKPQTHEVERVSPIPIYRQTELADMMPTPEIDANAGRVDRGQEDEDQADFESTTHQKTIPIQGAVRHEFVGGESHLYNPNAVRSESSVDLMHEMDEHKDKKPIEERRTSEDESRLGTIPAIAAGAAGAIGTVIIADCITTENEPTETIVSDYHDISPDHPKDFDEIEHTKLEKVEKFEPNVDEAQAKEIEEALVREIVESDRPNDVPVAAIRRESTIDEHPENEEQPLVSYSDDEQTVLRAVELPDYDVPAEVEYIPIERSAEEMIEGDLLFRPDITNDDSKLTESASEQSIRSTNTVIHVKATEEQSEELLSTPETPQTEVQIGLPPSMSGSGLQDEVNTELAGEQQRFPIQELATQEFVPTDTDIDISVSASNEFAYEASPEDSVEHSIPTKEFHQENVFVESERSTSPRKEDVTSSNQQETAFVEEELLASSDTEASSKDVQQESEVASAKNECPTPPRKDEEETKDMSVEEERPMSPKIEERSEPSKHEEQSSDQSIGLGTMIVGGAALGAKKLFDAIRGEPKDEDDNVESTREQLDTTVKQESHVSTPEESEQELARDIVETEQISLEEQPPHEKQTPAKDNTPVETPLSTEEQPVVRNEEKKIPEMEIQETFDRKSDQFESIEVDVAIPEYAEHNETIVVSSPVVETSTAESPAIHESEPQFVTQELHFEAHEQTGEKPTDFNVTEIERPFEQKETIKSDEPPQQKTQEELTSGLLQTDESSSQTPISLATVDTMPSEAKDMKSNEMVDISPTEEDVPVISEALESVVDVETDDYRVREQTAELIAQKIDIEIAADKPPQTPTPDEYSQELIHEKESEEMAELVAGGIASLIVEEPALTESHHEVKSDEYLDSDKIHQESETKVHIENESTVVESTIQTEIIREVTPTTEFTADVESPLIESHETVPLSPKLEEMVSEPTTERTENIVEEVHDESKIKEENVEHSIEERATTIEIETKPKTPDDEYLHEFTRESIVVPAAHEQSTELIQSEGKVTEMPEETHSTHEFVSQDKHSEKSEPKDAQATEEQSSADSKIGIGTMILGAAVIGAKTAIDKIAEQLPQSSTEEHGYQEISEKADVSTPTSDVLTENTMQQKPQEHQRPTELVGEHSVEERDLDLQSPVSIASVPQDESGRIALDPMQQSIYVTGEEDDKVFGQTPTIIEGETEPLILSDIRKHRLESDIMEQSIYESPHKDEQAESPHLVETTRTPSPVLSRHEEFETTQLETPIKHSKLESHIETEHQFTDDGERVESSSIVYTPEFEHRQFSVSSPKRIDSIDELNEKHESVVVEEDIETPKDIKSENIIAYGQSERASPVQEVTIEKTVREKFHHESEDLVGSEDFQPKPTEQQSPLTEDVEFTQKPEPDELVESEEIAQPEVISTKSPTRMESPILQKTDEKLSPTTEFESHDLIESEDIASEPSNLEDPLSNLEKQSTDSKTKDDRESPSSDRNIGLGMMVTGAAVLGVQAVGEQIKKLGDKLQEGFTGDSKSDDEIVESEEYDRLDSTSKTTTHNVVEHSTKSEDLPTPDDIVESENIRESPEEHIASPTPEHHSTITYDEPTIPIESEFTTNELVESKEIISPIIEAVKPDDTPTVVEEELVESENIDVKKKESSPPHEVIITKTETPSLNVPEGEAEQWSIESLKSFPMTGNNEIKTETGRVIPEENVAIKFVTDEEPIVGEHAEYIVDSEAIEENQPTKGRRYSVEVSEQQAESLATDIVERDDVEHGDYSQRPESPSVQEATQLIEKTEHIGQTAKELVESEEVEIEPSLKSEAFDQSAELKSEQKPAEQFAGEVVETEAITEMPANREDERQSEMILDVGSLKTPKKHQTFDEFPQDQDLVESESVDQSEEQIYEVPKDEVSLLSPTDGPEIVESEDVRYSPEVLVESPRLTPSAPSMSPTEIQEVEQTVERTESSIKTESPIAEDVVESNEIDTSITDKNPMEESTAEEKTLIQFDTPREELKTEEMIELNDEPSKTTPQEPEREELSEAIDEQLDKSDEKVGLGTIIAGAVAIGAKTIGEKLEEFGDKLEEKFVAPQKDEEERTDEQTVPSSQQKEDTIIERENTPTVEWPSSTVEDQRPIVEKQSSTSGEEYLTDQKELSAQAIEEYVLEPISSSEIPRSSTEVDEKLKATTAEMPVDVNAAPLITEPDAAIVKPTPQPETGSNESLDGSEELESERIQQLNEPIKKIPETMQPSNEIPDEPSPIMEVKPSHLNDEEVELLDDTTGYFGHSDEESYLTQETTQPTVLTEELTTETAHEELEVPVSHRELTPEDDFELVPREEEMIVNESPDLALPDQRAVSESPVESIPPDTQSPKPSELSSEHEKVESEHAHDSQQKTVSEDELARRDSDHTQHMETAERIAREAVESGTYESQFHMDGIEVPSGEQTTETKRTTPSESPLLIVEEEVELPNEPTSRATIDYSRLMQERSDSAGTEVGRDRPFTSEDFGGEVPENLQEGSDDEMKPSKEFFGEARDFTTDQNLKFEAKSSGPKEESEDDELADFDVVEQNEADEAAKATGTGGLMVEEIAVRPRSPIPPRWQSIDQSGGEPTVTTSVTPLTIHETESIPESAETDVSVILVRKPGEIGAHRKSDDGSESSLQEFERLELEVKQPIPVTATASATAIGTNGSPTSVGEEEVADMIVSATGSLNSLAEFESLEREVLEEQMVAAGGAEVMILSDIREESEVEEMSVREDDDEADSLNELQERAAAAVDAVAMITSADSLEPSAIPPSVEQAISAAIEAGHRMETSVDSLDAVRPTSHADDSLLEGVSHQENQSQDTQAALSQETAATFQEYHEDDRDSLEGVIEDYPTTLTTYETIQTTDDGSTETITRRVLTRVTDPVHSHIRFTGTENEDRLRNIQPEERIESVDEEGNITTTVRRRTPTLP